ncbi:MAG: NAD(P)(+) transhydrogenase (Re/Si-specific) subunit beta [Pirellulales bacterium]|nr:NAD(P)(+) transhydrogenase (Re/Si-specific) subunit beta [Pirellulales bacterium]
MDLGYHLLIDAVVVLILLFGIRQFRSASGARFGNLAAAFALFCALVIVWCRNPVLEPSLVIVGLLAGGAIGWLVALRVNMIQIPAMVAFQHGAGGVAAFIISFVELTRESGELTAVGLLSGILGVVIGAATFSGSMIASLKLGGLLRQTPTLLPKHTGILAGVLLLLLILGAVAWNSGSVLLLGSSLGLVVCAIALGIVFSIRIGGADMPVLISFLNATAGLAASFCGIIIQNRLLIACGATVAASGSLLTYAMCRAMNRNLWEVFIPRARPAASSANQAPAAARPPVAAAPETTENASSQQPPIARAAEAAKSAQKVIIVPGYGMALAHAQFEVVKFAERLEKMGKKVSFAVHPIAGRMPGHMHVLLAEAEADPDALFDMAEINAEFSTTDLVVIVGACDVVNPAAIHAENTPISGMPILAAHEAKQIAVFNLDARPGYSGVENPLYTNPKTILAFGDAKASLAELLNALQ